VRRDLVAKIVEAYDALIPAQKKPKV
jgi:hypothetical protein